MISNKYPGKFIVFEGLDGSGQSTQVGLLAKFLENRGYKVLATKEPTIDSEAGRKLRNVLDEREKISPREIQELFVEDRKWHLEKVIVPALQQGKTVISDRYFFSTFAYGMADGLSEDWLLKVNENFLLPDLVFFLDAKPEICLQRIEDRGKEKTLFEKKEKLEKVYQNYNHFLKKFASQTKIYLINGEKSIKQVFKDICQKII